MRLRTFIITFIFLISSAIEINLEKGYTMQCITILYISMFLILNRKRLQCIV